MSTTMALPMRALLFANAEQTLYTVKKTSSSASVGVGVVGSISLPIGQSQDSLIKIGAETVPARPFYQRFFALVRQDLGSSRRSRDRAGDAAGRTTSAGRGRLSAGPGTGPAAGSAPVPPVPPLPRQPAPPADADLSAGGLTVALPAVHDR